MTRVKHLRLFVLIGALLSTVGQSSRAMETEYKGLSDIALTTLNELPPKQVLLTIPKEQLVAHKGNIKGLLEKQSIHIEFSKHWDEDKVYAWLMKRAEGERKPFETKPLLNSLDQLPKLLKDAKHLLKTFLPPYDFDWYHLEDKHIRKRSIGRLYTYAKLQQIIDEKNLTHVRLPRKFLVFKDLKTGRFVTNPSDAQDILDKYLQVEVTWSGSNIPVAIEIEKKVYWRVFEPVIFAEKITKKGNGLSKQAMDELKILCEAVPFDVGFDNIFWDASGNAIIIDTENKGEGKHGCTKLERYSVTDYFSTDPTENFEQFKAFYERQRQEYEELGLPFPNVKYEWEKEQLEKKGVPKWKSIYFKANAWQDLYGTEQRLEDFKAVSANKEVLGQVLKDFDKKNEHEFKFDLKKSAFRFILDNMHACKQQNMKSELDNLLSFRRYQDVADILSIALYFDITCITKYANVLASRIFTEALSTNNAVLLQSVLRLNEKYKFFDKLYIDYSILSVRSPLLAEMLIDAGADPDYKGYLTTPLENAIERDNVEVVRMLLQKGANPNLTYHPTGLTPLMVAILEARNEKNKNILDIIKLLLADNRIDLTIKDNQGDTALDIAQTQLGYTKEPWHKTSLEERRRWADIVGMIKKAMKN